MEPKKASSSNLWRNRLIGITGAKGSFSTALIKQLRAKGAIVIGLTHGSSPSIEDSLSSPNEWVKWKCGQEEMLDETLSRLDILILNHGINPKGVQTSESVSETLEVNALSTWRLINRYEQMNAKEERSNRLREIWVNTSEAEIQPAFSPGYEISKRLIGQLVSLRWNNYEDREKDSIRFRKFVLGPFRSALNPIGIMSPDFVANQVIKQIELNLNLIIVTPNPFTYIIMPLMELIRIFYSSLTKLYK